MNQFENVSKEEENQESERRRKLVRSGITF